MPAKKRPPEATWKAIQKHSETAEIDRFLAKSRAEVDASLRAAGEDPDAIRAEGAALAKKLSADRARLAWQVEAAEAMARDEARRAAHPSKYASLDRAALEARLTAARTSPRFAQPVAVMFRNRKVDEATDDELRAILDDLDELAGEGDE